MLASPVKFPSRDIYISLHIKGMGGWATLECATKKNEKQPCIVYRQNCAEKARLQTNDAIPIVLNSRIADNGAIVNKRGPSERTCNILQTYYWGP